MLTAAIENLTETLEELKPFFPAHWLELGLWRDKMPLDPDYAEYLRRDGLGMLTLATVRDDGALIGYAVFQIAPAMHYRSTLAAHMDLIYLEPTKRGAGAGRMLGEVLIAELKRRGVGPIYAGSKNHKGIEGFWRSLGLEPVETIMGAWIGE
jgi:GNAT superfamily N-acetyltransferase